MFAFASSELDCEIVKLKEAVVTGFNGKDGSRRDEATQNPQKNQMSKVSKKGKTLGAQHASHGDSGVEKMTPKTAKK